MSPSERERERETDRQTETETERSPGYDGCGASGRGCDAFVRSLSVPRARSIGSSNDTLRLLVGFQYRCSARGQ